MSHLREGGAAADALAAADVGEVGAAREAEAQSPSARVADRIAGGLPQGAGSSSPSARAAFLDWIVDQSLSNLDRQELEVIAETLRWAPRWREFAQLAPLSRRLIISQTQWIANRLYEFALRDARTRAELAEFERTTGRISAPHMSRHEEAETLASMGPFGMLAFLVAYATSGDVHYAAAQAANAAPIDGLVQASALVIGGSRTAASSRSRAARMGLGFTLRYEDPPGDNIFNIERSPTGGDSATALTERDFEPGTTPGAGADQDVAADTPRASASAASPNVMNMVIPATQTDRTQIVTHLRGALDRLTVLIVRGFGTSSARSRPPNLRARESLESLADGARRELLALDAEAQERPSTAADDAFIRRAAEVESRIGRLREALSYLTEPLPPEAADPDYRRAGAVQRYRTELESQRREDAARASLARAGDEPVARTDRQVAALLGLRGRRCADVLTWNGTTGRFIIADSKSGDPHESLSQLQTTLEGLTRAQARTPPLRGSGPLRQGQVDARFYITPRNFATHVAAGTIRVTGTGVGRLMTIEGTGEATIAAAGVTVPVLVYVDPIAVSIPAIKTGDRIVDLTSRSAQPSRR